MLGHVQTWRGRLIPVALGCWLLGSFPGAAAPDRSFQEGRRHWSTATSRVVLDNGLTLLMLQRGELPIVSVQALYRVGSRNEWPGITGGAHYVEHMAFRATEAIAKQDLTNQILRWGGRWNGYTSYDQTVYGSHTPSQHLEWLIYLERQRMRHVLFTPEEVEKERTSVIAELRQYENSPRYILVSHRLRRASLVAHPYGSPIMGQISDLEGVTTGELEGFYRDYYAPNNLILAIVGRFDRAEALGLVRKHFGDLTADGRSTEVRTVEPEQRGERRVTLRMPGSASHLELLVHAPAAKDEAFATLLALDGVLAGGKAPGRGGARPGSRLHRALVEPGLATSVSGGVELSEYPGLYAIGVSAPADADLAAIEARLDEALGAAAQDVTAGDVERAVGQVRAALAFDADSNRAIANLLTVYEQLDSFKLLADLPRRLEAVTAERVRELARVRLAPDRRSIGMFVPQPAAAPERTSPDGSAAVQTGSWNGAGVGLEAARATSHSLPPRLEVPDLPAPTVRRLENGLRALALQTPGEVVHLRVRIEGGAVHDPAGREGTALLAARLLAGGDLTGALADRHVRFTQSASDLSAPFANRHFVELSATLFPGDLAEVARLLGAAMIRPAFPEESVARAKRSLRAQAAGFEDDSRWRADRAVFDRLFPAAHPYGRPPEGNAESVERIAPADLVAFHQAHYRPERVVVAVAGGLEAGEALAAVERAFGAWRGAGRPPAPLPAADPAARERLDRVHVPLDKEQASISVGLPGVDRQSADFTALAALNYLLGETGYAGRLGEVLVDPGIAYAVYASVLADRHAGPILITTDAARAGEALDRIINTLEAFATRGVSEAELQEAKGFLLGRLLFRFESPQAVTATLAELGYFGDRAALEPFAREVLALTVDDLNAAARRFYDPARAVAVIAGR